MLDHQLWTVKAAVEKRGRMIQLSMLLREGCL
jgi:hypothetical protein